MGKGGGKGGLSGEFCQLFQGVGLCACILLFAGPILLVFGGIFLNLGIQNFRQAHINDQNLDVNNFNAALVQGFKYQNFSVSFNGSVNCPKLDSVQLKVDTNNDDYYPNSDRSAFNPYQDFKYVAQLPQLVGNQTGCTLSMTYMDGQNVVAIFNLSLANAQVSIPTSSLQCTANSLSCYAQACDGYGGVLSADAQYCLMSRISGICIRVKQSDNGVYVESNQSPLGDMSGDVGYGCYGMQTVAKQFSRISILPPCFEVNSTQSQQPVASYPQIEVRHANDPYVAYQFISRGQCKFGEKRQRQFSIGISLCVVGAVITILWLVAIFFLLSKLFNRQLKRTQTQKPLPMNNLDFLDPAKKGGYTPTNSTNSHRPSSQQYSNSKIKHGQYPFTPNGQMYKSSSQYSNEDRNSQQSSSNKSAYPYYKPKYAHHNKEGSSHNEISPKYATNGVINTQRSPKVPLEGPNNMDQLNKGPPAQNAQQSNGQNVNDRNNEDPSAQTNRVPKQVQTNQQKFQQKFF